MAGTGWQQGHWWYNTLLDDPIDSSLRDPTRPSPAMIRRHTYCKDLDDEWLTLIGRLSQWRLKDVKFFFLQYNRLVNPLQELTRYSMSKKDLAVSFQTDENDALLNAVYERFKRPTESVDSNEIFAGLALLCVRDDFEARLKFIYNLCIHDEFETELLEDDVCVLLGWLTSALTNLGLIEGVADAHVDRVAGEAFLDYNGNLREEINFSEFLNFVTSNPHTQKILGTLELIPRSQDACRLILYRSCNLARAIVEISGYDYTKGFFDIEAIQNLENFQIDNLVRLCRMWREGPELPHNDYPEPQLLEEFTNFDVDNGKDMGESEAKGQREGVILPSVLLSEETKTSTRASTANATISRPISGSISIRTGTRTNVESAITGNTGNAIVSGSSSINNLSAIVKNRNYDQFSMTSKDTDKTKLDEIHPRYPENLWLRPVSRLRPLTGREHAPFRHRAQFRDDVTVPEGPWRQEGIRYLRCSPESMTSEAGTDAARGIPQVDVILRQAANIITTATKTIEILKRKGRGDGDCAYSSDQSTDRFIGPDLLLTPGQKSFNGILDFDESVHVLCGPVIGKVTQNEAVILLEVDREAWIQCLVFDANHVSEYDKTPERILTKQAIENEQADRRALQQIISSAEDRLAVANVALKEAQENIKKAEEIHEEAIAKQKKATYEGVREKKIIARVAVEEAKRGIQAALESLQRVEKRNTICSNAVEEAKKPLIEKIKKWNNDLENGPPRIPTVLEIHRLLPKRSPRSFFLYGLEPGKKYTIIFSGISSHDAASRRAVLSTFSSDNEMKASGLNMIAVSGYIGVDGREGDEKEKAEGLSIGVDGRATFTEIWENEIRRDRESRKKVKDVKDEKQPPVVLHLGEQLDINAMKSAVRHGAAKLRDHRRRVRRWQVGTDGARSNKPMLQDRNELFEEIRETMREVYRKAWNWDSYNSILSHSCNIMASAWVGLELKAGEGSGLYNDRLENFRGKKSTQKKSGNEENFDIDTVAVASDYKACLDLAKQVLCEYEVQLTRPDYDKEFLISKSPHAAAVFNAEQIHFERVDQLSGNAARRKAMGIDDLSRDASNLFTKEIPGVIEVTIHSATNLPIMDRRSSDPYASFKCVYGKRRRLLGRRKKTYKTKAIKKTTDPVWNETFTLEFGSWQECVDAEWKVELFDWDLIGKHQLMSFANIQHLLASGNLRDEVKWTTTIPLQNKKEREEISTLKVSLTARGFGEQQTLMIGDIVEVNYQGLGEWYVGEITLDRGDRSYNIEYENGEREEGVIGEFVRFRRSLTKEEEEMEKRAAEKEEMGKMEKAMTFKSVEDENPNGGFWLGQEIQICLNLQKIKNEESSVDLEWMQGVITRLNSKASGCSTYDIEYQIETNKGRTKIKAKKNVAGELLIPANIDASEKWIFEVISTNRSKLFKKNKGYDYYDGPEGFPINAGKEVAQLGTIFVAKQQLGTWIRTYENKWLPLEIDGKRILKTLQNPNEDEANQDFQPQNDNAAVNFSQKKHNPRRKKKASSSSSINTTKKMVGRFSNPKRRFAKFQLNKEGKWWATQGHSYHQWGNCGLLILDARSDNLEGTDWVGGLSDEYMKSIECKALIIASDQPLISHQYSRLEKEWEKRASASIEPLLNTLMATKAAVPVNVEVQIMRCQNLPSPSFAAAKPEGKFGWLALKAKNTTRFNDYFYWVHFEENKTVDHSKLKIVFEWYKTETDTEAEGSLVIDPNTSIIEQHKDLRKRYNNFRVDVASSRINIKGETEYVDAEGNPLREEIILSCGKEVGKTGRDEWIQAFIDLQQFVIAARKTAKEGACVFATCTTTNTEFQTVTTQNRTPNPKFSNAIQEKGGRSDQGEKFVMKFDALHSTQQSKLDFYVYDGRKLREEDLLGLAELWLHDIPPGRHRRKVELNNGGFIYVRLYCQVVSDSDVETVLLSGSGGVGLEAACGLSMQTTVQHQETKQSIRQIVQGPTAGLVRPFHGMISNGNYGNTMYSWSHKPRGAVVNSYSVIECAVPKNKELVWVDQHSEKPQLLVGPVVGKCTPHSAIILVEIDRTSVISITLSDTRSKKVFTELKLIQGRKPTVILFKHLEAGRQYQLIVEGVSNSTEERRGLVSTPFSETSSLSITIIAKDGRRDAGPDLRDGSMGIKKSTEKNENENLLNDSMFSRHMVKFRPPWRRTIVMSPIDEPRGLAPSIAVHVGGQVFGNDDMACANTLYEQHVRASGGAGAGGEGVSDWDLSINEMQTSSSIQHERKDGFHGRQWEREQVEESVRELFRGKYRKSWGAKDKRWLLSHCSNIMVWGEGDLCTGAFHGEAIHPRVFQLARDVIWEYQRQLWDDMSWAPKLIPRHALCGVSHDGNFHRVGDTGFLLLDCRSSRMANGYLNPNAPILSQEQWRMIKSALDSNAEEPGHGMKTLIVCSELPLLRDDPEIAKLKAHVEPMMKSGWCGAPKELAKLLDILFTWMAKETDIDRRQAVIVTSGGVSNAAYRATVTDIENPSYVIPQIAAGPITLTQDEVTLFDERTKLQTVALAGFHNLNRPTTARPMSGYGQSLPGSRPLTADTKKSRFSSRPATATGRTDLLGTTDERLPSTIDNRISHGISRPVSSRSFTAPEGIPSRPLSRQFGSSRPGTSSRPGSRIMNRPLSSRSIASRPGSRMNRPVSSRSIAPMANLEKSNNTLLEAIPTTSFFPTSGTGEAEILLQINEPFMPLEARPLTGFLSGKIRPYSGRSVVGRPLPKDIREEKEEKMVQAFVSEYGCIDSEMRFQFRVENELVQEPNFGQLRLINPFYDDALKKTRGIAIDRDIYSQTDCTATLLIGPVIGKVTTTTAVVMLEVDCESDITCVIRDDITGEEKEKMIEMPERRPRGFFFKELNPGRLYHVRFKNIHQSEDHVGSFCTFLEEPNFFRFFAVGDDDVECASDHRNSWAELEARIKETSNGLRRRVSDLLVHIGGQAMVGKAFGVKEWKAHAEAMQSSEIRGSKHFDAEELVLCEARIKAQMRDIYRASWGVPERRFVLANTPNLAIWNERDLHNGIFEMFQKCELNTDFEGRQKAEEILALPSATVFLKYARQLYWEYQRQLWQPEYMGAGGEDEHYFCRLTPQCGILFVEPFANRLSADGTPKPGQPMMSSRQIEFVRSHLAQADADLEAEEESDDEEMDEGDGNLSNTISKAISCFILVTPIPPSLLPDELKNELYRWEEKGLAAAREDETDEMTGKRTEGHGRVPTRRVFVIGGGEMAWGHLEKVRASEAIRPMNGAIVGPLFWMQKETPLQVSKEQLQKYGEYAGERRGRRSGNLELCNSEMVKLKQSEDNWMKAFQLEMEDSKLSVQVNTFDEFGTFGSLDDDALHVLNKLEKGSRTVNEVPGQVIIEVIKASNLPPVDGTTADPYVKLSSSVYVTIDENSGKKGKQSFRTQTVYRELNPVFEIEGKKEEKKEEDEMKKEEEKKQDGKEEREGENDVKEQKEQKIIAKKHPKFTFSFDNWEQCKDSNITVEVWDEDKISSNDLMSIGVIDNFNDSNLVDENVVERIISLQAAGDGKKVEEKEKRKGVKTKLAKLIIKLQICGFAGQNKESSALTKVIKGEETKRKRFENLLQSKQWNEWLWPDVAPCENPAATRLRIESFAKIEIYFSPLDTRIDVSFLPQPATVTLLVIGKVEATTAVVLVEWDENRFRRQIGLKATKSAEKRNVTLSLVDVLTTRRHRATLKDVQPRRARAFRFKNLTPNRMYRVETENLHMPPGIIGKVITPAKEGKKMKVIVVNGDDHRCDSKRRKERCDLWKQVQEWRKVPRMPLTVCIHIGGSVYLEDCFFECQSWMLRHLPDPNPLLRKKDRKTVSDEFREEIYEQCKEHIRDAYRTQWNTPYKKAVLNQFSNYFIVGEDSLKKSFMTGHLLPVDEIKDDSDDEENSSDDDDEEEITKGNVPKKEQKLRGKPYFQEEIIKLMLEVAHEYQWQCSEPNYFSNREKDKYANNELFSLAKVGNIGILQLDCRGNRLRNDGSVDLDREIISTKQLRFVENSLKNENTPGMLALLVLSELPIVYMTEETSSKKVLHPETGARDVFLKEHFCYRNNGIAETLLGTIFDFQQQHNGSDICFFNSGLHHAMTTEVTDTKWVKTAKQYSVGCLKCENQKPVQCEAKGTLKKRFTYKHTKLSSQKKPDGSGFFDMNFVRHYLFMDIWAQSGERDMTTPETVVEWVRPPMVDLTAEFVHDQYKAAGYEGSRVYVETELMDVSMAGLFSWLASNLSIDYWWNSILPLPGERWTKRVKDKVKSIGHEELYYKKIKKSGPRFADLTKALRDGDTGQFIQTCIYNEFEKRGEYASAYELDLIALHVWKECVKHSRRFPSKDDPNHTEDLKDEKLTNVVKELFWFPEDSLRKYILQRQKVTEMFPPPWDFNGTYEAVLGFFNEAFHVRAAWYAIVDERAEKEYYEDRMKRKIAKRKANREAKRLRREARAKKKKEDQMKRREAKRIEAETRAALEKSIKQASGKSIQSEKGKGKGKGKGKKKGTGKKKGGGGKGKGGKVKGEGGGGGGEKKKKKKKKKGDSGAGGAKKKKKKKKN
eukprot:g3426.t1